MMFRFQRFQVYKDAKILHSHARKLAALFPREFWYLADQMRRASLSIALNIAEGSAKNSDKDFRRYLANALGSANELAAILDICVGEELITDAKGQEVLEMVNSVRNQLGGFSKRLSKDI